MKRRAGAGRTITTRQLPPPTIILDRIPTPTAADMQRLLDKLQPKQRKPRK
jgi:hypothetical protein